jgi:hypothetical protein
VEVGEIGQMGQIRQIGEGGGSLRIVHEFHHHLFVGRVGGEGDFRSGSTVSDTRAAVKVFHGFTRIA